MFEQVLDAVRAHDRIIIHRHFRPDGDAIGSQTGLKYLIKANFPDKEVYSVGDDPARYGFIEGCAVDTASDDMYTRLRRRIADKRHALFPCKNHRAP